MWFKRRVRPVQIVLCLVVVLGVGGLLSISFDVTPETNGKTTTDALTFEEPALQIYKPVIVSEKKKRVSVVCFFFFFLFSFSSSRHSVLGSKTVTLLPTIWPTIRWR